MIIQIILVSVWIILIIINAWLYYKTINHIDSNSNKKIKDQCNSNTQLYNKLEIYTIKEIENIYQKIDYKREKELEFFKKIEQFEKHLNKLDYSKTFIFKYLLKYINKNELEEVETIINEMKEAKNND